MMKLEESYLVVEYVADEFVGVKLMTDFVEYGVGKDDVAAAFDGSLVGHFGPLEHTVAVVAVLQGLLMAAVVDWGSAAFH
jgi:hypothetical protein